MAPSVELVNPTQGSNGDAVDVKNAAVELENVKSQEHVVFLDPVGTRWTFPYDECKTWTDVKKLIKAVFVDCFLPDRYGEILDQGESEDVERNFSIVKVQPDPTIVLSRHWETLVSPGWEFRIEFYHHSSQLYYILSAKAERKEKAAANAADAPATIDEEIAKVLYTAEFLVPDGDGYYRYESTKSLKDKQFTVKPPSDNQNGKCVLEEQREVWCSNKDITDVKPDMIDSSNVPVLYIRSPMLMNAIKAVIHFQCEAEELNSKEWNGRSISSDIERGRFVYPFTDLVHHRQALVEYQESLKDVHDSEYTETSRNHIDTLIEYLYDQPSIGLKEADLIWAQDIPKVSFRDLWLLLKPGSDVYVQEDGELNAYVIESYDGGIDWSFADLSATSYGITVWNLNFDGEFLTRSAKRVNITAFDGDREVRSLPLYPVSLHRDEDPQNPLSQQLVERGKRFAAILKKPTLQEYSGPSKLQGIRTYNRARVVVDHTSQPWKTDHDDVEEPVTTPYGVELGQRTRIAKCPCKQCETNTQVVQLRKYEDYDNINLKLREKLTDHQYLLCGSHVWGFVLKDRAWDLLNVTGLEEPRIQKNIIDMLVMKPEGNKHMIKAICEIYGGSYAETFSSDFIRGKGEGQIILLHGPPGTGKTLTAESVAEYTSRPLLSITAADLGDKPEKLERNLIRFFRDAQKWNAIVLLDEADVYLESRSTQDLRRNSIVSIFLRALDYFQGILFLTTNRIGSFDEAFLSRIHIQIGYDRLDESSRQQIWENSFKKLARNHEINGQEIRCSWDAKEFVQKSPRLKDLQWNGREIRNAFQTAVALACFQAKQDGDHIPVLTDSHLSQVVDMSHNFKNYLRSFQAEDRPFQEMIRNDDYDSKGKTKAP